MSDTVYEKDGLAVTRYWGGPKGDCIQITVVSPDRALYSTMTLAEFKKMVKAIYKNVRETKNAWWHSTPGFAESKRRGNG